jgi:hypothetical protein
VAKCRRLLCLSKLAAHASGGKPQQARLQAQASARLRQLTLQQELQLNNQQGPLSSAQLALAALEVAEASQGPEAAEAAVAAVEALALSPEQSQSEQYRYGVAGRARQTLICCCVAGFIVCPVVSWSRVSACRSVAAWMPEFGSRGVAAWIPMSMVIPAV